MSGPLHQIQIGELPTLKKPALVPFDGSRAVAIAHSAGNMQPAANLLEAHALQLLGRHLPGQARLVLYEPTPSPQFAHLKRTLAQTDRSLGQQLISADAWHLHLTQLIETAHLRFALLAAAQASDMVAYNSQAARPEPIEYVLVSAVLAGAAHERDLAALHSLCVQGPRVGIYLLMLRGPAELEENASTLPRKPLQNFWAELMPTCFGFDWRGAAPKPLNQPAELWRLFNQFGIRVGAVAAQSAGLADALVARVAQAKEDSPHSDFLRIPIGTVGVDAAHLCMGDASKVYHAMIGGTSQSGKSTLVNNFILQMCEQFSPQDLQLWLFDFAGVEFNIFAGLPHLATLQLPQADLAPMLSELERFEQLIETRRNLFQQASPPQGHIDGYNANAASNGSALLPRCLLIADEAQVLFEGNHQTRAFVRNLFSRIARQGAKFGVHIVLATQSFESVDLERDAKGQVRLRIGLQMATDMASKALMGRDNYALKNLPRHTAIYNAEFGEDAHNRHVQLHHLTRQERTRRIEVLKKTYPAAQQNLAENGPAQHDTKQVATATAATQAKPDANEPLNMTDYKNWKPK